MAKTFILQSVLVPKDSFNRQEAIGWILKHKFKPHFYRKKVELIANFYHFRQAKVPDAKKVIYKNKKLPNDVVLVLYKNKK